MVEASKYCTDVVEKHFNKKLELIKKDDEYFNNSAKCWICDNVYVKNDGKVKVHWHITGKYRDLAHKDCNIKVKLNHKILIVFYNL